MAFKIPTVTLRYKFLAVLMLITLTAIGVFLRFTNQIFSEDKKLFVMDLNLTLLRAATAEVKLELRARLDDLQVLIPRVFRPSESEKASDIYEGLAPTLKEEVLRLRIIRNVPNAPTKTLEVVREYVNSTIADKRKLQLADFNTIDKEIPIDTDAFFKKPELLVLNRSMRFGTQSQPIDVGIITFVLPGSFLDSESKDFMIVVDVLQDFLRRRLNQSDFAQLFLIHRNGSILSHPTLSATITYTKKPFPHPITSRLQARLFQRESYELNVDGEPYLVNLSETGFPDILAVSQVPEHEAFTAMRLLMEKSILIGAAILCLAVIVSILFAARLTSNIQKLKLAAEQVGQGNLKVDMNIRSNDEIQNVAESFSWMMKRLEELLIETASKARMEEELSTARLIQSTLLTSPQIDSDAVEIEGYYMSASECGGDVWDAHLDGSRLTLFIADATGHGAGAAIVTALAKSCFSTLNAIYAGQPLLPDQLLAILNLIISRACKGQLLMTMCVMQIDLDTGDIQLANAGHENPLCARRKTTNGKKAVADTLFARGERLGFDEASEYTTEKFKLEPGDTVLLYTDGVSEAHNAEGKDFGERKLKKLLAEGGPRPTVAMKDQLVNAIATHTQGVPPADDITFVLVTYKRKSEKREEEAA